MCSSELTTVPADSRIVSIPKFILNDKLVHINDIAERIGISASRLQHLFGEVTGLQLGHYMRDLRLAESAVLLVSTTKPVKEIAFCAGYSSSAAFVRAFKLRCGEPPKAFRRRHFFDQSREVTAEPAIQGAAPRAMLTTGITSLTSLNMGRQDACA